MTDYSREYFVHSRQEMLGFVPGTVSTVLELGCAAGNFGAGIKAKYGAEVWGVEMDSSIAAIARNQLDHVLVKSVEDSLVALPENYFDCVVCNDILEHLSNPVAILSALRRVFSNKDPVLVGSIPNVRYFPVLFDLVWNADWRYADYGVLDRTHLRFFTRKSWERTLRESGYEPLETVGINPTPSLKAKVAAMLSLGRLKDTRFLQYAFVARPLEQD